MPYRLGKRQATIDRTRERIAAAAKELVAAGQPATVAAIARKAGVARVTVYNTFGSRSGLLAGLIPNRPLPVPSESTAVEQLRRLLRETSALWAANPPLFRHLPGVADSNSEVARQMAEHLAEADALRPGCSIKEAEDVIGTLTSFAVFDRLHRDGRRPPGAVAEILMRLAGGGILAYHP